MPAGAPSAVPAGQDDDGGLVALLAAGPGLREDDGWLAESRREGLLAELLATVSARAAAAAGTSLVGVSFTAVLALVRDQVTAEVCCRHCGKRPAGADAPLARLNAAVAAQPRNRERRTRTFGR